MGAEKLFLHLPVLLLLVDAFGDGDEVALGLLLDLALLAEALVVPAEAAALAFLGDLAAESIKVRWLLTLT